MRTLHLCILAALLPVVFAADSYDAKLFQEMRWRSIGPVRGGRTRACSGVPSQPNVFYIGPVDGGVFKTNDYGRTWVPIFDGQPTGSIGAIAVAVSNPKIIYVGSGEGLQRPDLATGDGMYKSTDAGKTWTHLAGLRDTQQIPQIAVDPRNPNRLFVAALGHPYGPNAERGIFRSTDGGATFEKVLYKDENTGGSDVQIDPSNPNIVYAGMWEARQGPWENASWGGTNGGLFKSIDGGTTWHPLTKGLPDGVIQVNVAIAQSQPSRIFAAVANARGTGIYRSDDSGESWVQITRDQRAAARIGGGDLPVLAVDSKNPETVYSASVVTWKSTDGGKTWTAIRGAPGGDDYQKIWINPDNPKIILIASDQGAIITVNGGESWSSWFTQTTAAMYHVAADNAFPYRLCSGQQDSGSACVESRGNDGQITYRDWHPAGVEEYGYAAPDPLDPNVIYGGKVTRYDRRTGQIENVSPKPVRGGDFRALRTAPVLFSPVDPHTMYFAGNTLWKTRDAGRNWRQISPDLSRKTWEIPASVGKYRDSDTAKATQRGVIYTVAPSPLDINRIWAGTDDGLIHVTVNGGQNWKDVTPPELGPFMKVSIIDAGHFDSGTAYAAINTLRLDDMRPHILRTHDAGKTWTEIVTGIQDGAPVNTVREDPKCKGLLYAGTEQQVYVSFDDGEHWQSLRLNMPATSIRDLIVKDDDLAVGTHGRGFWILDDITPLRQMDAKVAGAEAFLFKPQTALRIRWNMNPDTPVPPDEPAGQNPPEGAILDYYLGADVSGPVTLEFLDGAGTVVRRYSSADPIQPLDSTVLDVPTYWARAPRPLSNAAGMHRFLWDVHLSPMPHARVALPMQAILHDTAPAATSPWALPGAYTVKLTANGTTYSQPLTVKMDPRVKTPVTGLAQQYKQSKQIYDAAAASADGLEQLRVLREQIGKLQDRSVVSDFEKSLMAIGGNAGGRFGGGRGAAPGPDTLASVQGGLIQLLALVQEADVAPTPSQVAAASDRRQAAAKLMQRWKTLIDVELPKVNQQLKQANLPALSVN